VPDEGVCTKTKRYGENATPSARESVASSCVDAWSMSISDGSCDTSVFLLIASTYDGKMSTALTAMPAFSTQSPQHRPRRPAPMTVTLDGGDEADFVMATPPSAITFGSPLSSRLGMPLSGFGKHRLWTVLRLYTWRASKLQNGQNRTLVSVSGEIKDYG
jgi:hypothetical protein